MCTADSGEDRKQCQGEHDTVKTEHPPVDVGNAVVHIVIVLPSDRPCGMSRGAES